MEEEVDSIQKACTTLNKCISEAFPCDEVHVAGCAVLCGAVLTTLAATHPTEDRGCQDDADG